MIQSFDNTAACAEIVAALRRDGCAIVRGLADASTVKAVRAEFAPYLAAIRSEPPKNVSYRSVGEEFLPGNTTRVTGAIAKSPTCRSLVTHPVILSICDAILLPNCSSYQVCTTAALEIHPGAPAQALHREDLLWPYIPFPHENLEVATMWAISDFTQANGATRLVPSSHLWPSERVARDEEVVAAEMPSGSVLLWLDHTFHAAGANCANMSRFGLALIYNLGWLRQEENQYLAVPPEVARTLPEKLQRLVGYQMHEPGLGFVGGVGQEPLELLQA
jgi:ectoine hydroxylase-related dioxygenase (phytanoyl-CoA dioxygenase family)